MRSFSCKFFLAIALALWALGAPALVPEPKGSDWEDANANIFLVNEVTRVDVTIDPFDFQALLDNPYSDEEKSATIRWRNSVIDETLESVGFRVRGNTSRGAARKSWKLDLRTFVADRTFHGLEEINLNGSSNDPTIVRSMIAWEVIHRMGIPGSRTHLVAMYVNGTFWSLQTHIEHFDEEFAETRFGNKDGNLYKCLYKGAKADLSYVSDEDYTNYAGGEVYRETNNENDPAHDYSDIADFIRLIRFGSDSEVLDQLDYHVDTDGFLRYLAADVACGSWDDYWFGSNNYYLYHNEESDRFQWMPYDYDNSFGIDYFGKNWSTRHFDNWGDGGFGTSPAPLVDRVFDQSEWRRQYRRYLLKAADILDDPGLHSQIMTWHNLVTPYMDGTIESGGVVGAQPYSANALDVPATWDGFGAFDGHRIGVLPFMTERAASLRQQVADFASLPALPPVRINEAMPSNTTTVADEFGEYDDWLELYNDGDSAIDLSGWHVTDDVTSPTKYILPAGTTIAGKGFLVIWADDQPEQGPLHAPFKLSAAGEHLGLFWTEPNGRVLIDDLAMPAVPTNQSFGRYPDGADDTQLMSNPTPGAANDNTHGGGGEPRLPPRLYINEFMAGNTHTIQDESGKWEDWVEIFNAEQSTVDMSGLHMTDDLANPTKWQIPAGVSIPAGGFLLFWCDEDTDEGPLHADLKLSKGGEAIGLFDNEENQFQPIDTLTFGAQTDDVSSGRLPDGDTAIVVLQRPTPGSTNNPGGYWSLY